jgi:hypothetical protein
MGTGSEPGGSDSGSTASGEVLVPIFSQPRWYSDTPRNTDGIDHGATIISGPAGRPRPSIHNPKLVTSQFRRAKRRTASSRPSSAALRPRRPPSPRPADSDAAITAGNRSPLRRFPIRVLERGPKPTPPHRNTNPTGHRIAAFQEFVAIREIKTPRTLLAPSSRGVSKQGEVGAGFFPAKLPGRLGSHDCGKNATNPLFLRFWMGGRVV